MRKKFVYLLICLSIVTSFILGACQPQATPEATEEVVEEETTVEETEESAPAEGEEEVITIEYWQYFFEARVNAMDHLIEEFEAENPNIKVVHNSDIPYGEFIDKVAASASAGTGPDVVSLFYGWIPSWVDAGYLAPLPEEEFPREWIEETYLPMVLQSEFLGEFWALPTAVRTLALLWNKDLFEAAGLDPDVPPTTLEELVEFAQATTVGEDPDYEVMGFPVEVPGQAHHWFREVLVRQFGGQPYTDDNKTVTWNSPEGCEAFQYMTAFETEYGTGSNDYFDGSTQAFLNGQSAIHIDGSFRLGTIAANAPDLNFGVAELPSVNGVKSTFGSYWTHGITKKAEADPAKLEASIKFLKFITSPEAGLYWAQNVGELPAQNESAENVDLLSDPLLGPFVAGLSYANATFFVDEKAQRESIVNAYDEFRLMGGDPCDILDYYAEIEQQVLDEFWANH